MTLRPAGLVAPSLLLFPFLLSSCGGPDPQDMPDANRSRAIAQQSDSAAIRTVASDALTGTPMQERVAVIGLLNKRNGLTRDLQMKPGQALRVGDAIVRLRACEQTAPWENFPETGAFLQLDVRSNADNKWRRVFSGWVFKNRPDRNVVQHPIYDVWVKSCAMAWPETGPDTVKTGEGGKSRSTAGQSSGSNASEAAEPAAEANNAPASPSGTPSTASDSNTR